jgi:hypothetical protein
LLAIGHAAVILTPSGLLGVPQEVRAGDMVVVADFSAAHPREKFLCPIRASAVEALGFLMIYALHFKAGMKIIPCGRIVGIDDSAGLNP